MDGEQIFALASGAFSGVITGGGAAWAFFRSWVSRMNKKAELVDRHEAQFRGVEAEMSSMHEELRRHADREEQGLDHLKSAIASVQADVGYMRGFIEGRRPESQ